MSDEPWWEPAAEGTSPAERAEPPASPAAAPAPNPAAPAVTEPESLSVRVESASGSELTWASSERSGRSILITASVVVALVIALMALRESADGSDTEQLEPALDAVGAELAAGVELVGGERPSRGGLGLDARFTDPRAWRVGDVVVVAYARDAGDDDASRIRTDGVIAQSLVDAAAGEGVLVADALARGTPAIRLVEVAVGDTTILHAVGLSDDGDSVLVVSASAPGRPAVDVVAINGVGLAAIG